MLTVKNKNKGILNIIIGVLITVIVMVIGGLVLTYMVDKEIIDQNILFAPMFIVRILAVFVGAWYACCLSSYKKIASSLLHGVSCCVLFLFVSLILLDAELDHAFVSIISIILTSLLPCIVGNYKKKGMKPIRYKVRNG